MRVGSKTLHGIHNIKHSRSKFGSKFMTLCYLHSQRKRLIIELARIDTRQEILLRRLDRVESEMNERVRDLKEGY